MDHHEFMHYLHHVPNHPSCKVVARVYKNAKGIDDVDWLEARGDINFSEWVGHCDNNPSEDWTLSHLLMYWLWLDCCERFRQGLPTRQPYPPQGYKGWADEYHAKKKESEPELDGWLIVLQDSGYCQSSTDCRPTIRMISTRP